MNFLRIDEKRDETFPSSPIWDEPRFVHFIDDVMLWSNQSCYPCVASLKTNIAKNGFTLYAFPPMDGIEEVTSSFGFKVFLNKEEITPYVIELENHNPLIRAFAVDLDGNENLIELEFHPQKIHIGTDFRNNGSNDEICIMELYGNTQMATDFFSNENTVMPKEIDMVFER